jgi:hypothetical protein
MPSKSRQELEKWLKTIDVKADRVIDVGGYIWSVASKVKSWEVKEYITIGEHKEADIFLNLNESSFWMGADALFATEVMQFIYNPLKALKNFRIFLKANGKLYINFHEKHRDCKGGDYLRYTEKGVRKLLEDTGFKIDDMKKVEGEDFITYFVKCSR